MKQRVTLAAELYYLYHLTQNEIANQLGVSRVWVGKLLKTAEDLGFVRIEVNTLSAGVTELETVFTEKFSLKRAKVVRCTGNEPCLQTTAHAAANYLAGILRHNDRLSTSWGATLAAIVTELVPLYFPDIIVTPFTGGFGYNPNVTPNQIAFSLAEKLSAKVAPLHAPGLMAGRQERDLLLLDPTIHRIIEESENADILLMGVGALRNPTLTATRAISEKELAELSDAGCVGEIGMNFIDGSGRLVDHPIQSRLVSGNLKKARQHAREVIVVGCGASKAEILRASMTGRWVDSVVTDETAARAVLNI